MGDGWARLGKRRPRGGSSCPPAAAATRSLPPGRGRGRGRGRAGGSGTRGRLGNVRVVWGRAGGSRVRGWFGDVRAARGMQGWFGNARLARGLAGGSGLRGRLGGDVGGWGTRGRFWDVPEAWGMREWLGDARAVRERGGSGERAAPGTRERRSHGERRQTRGAPGGGLVLCFPWLGLYTRFVGEQEVELGSTEMSQGPRYTNEDEPRAQYGVM